MTQRLTCLAPRWLLALALLAAAAGLAGGSAVDAGDGEGADDGPQLLSLQDGGHFVFWSFAEAEAADVFAGEAGGGASPIKIAWKFVPLTMQWNSYIPALGVINFALRQGDVLWVVSEGPQEIVVPDSGLLVRTLTLASEAFDNGDLFPLAYTCDGDNISPDFAWSGAPEGTQSFVIVMRDPLTEPPFPHWAIWDIPADVTSLPGAVENVAEPGTPAGAKQALSFDGNTRGYLGPCPPAGETHDYVFVLFALSVETLPDVDLSSSVDDVFEAVAGWRLDSTIFGGAYTS